MRFSLSWLRDHLATEASASAIAETLTAIGLEVESVTNPAALLGPFRIARVLTAERHPQADKLQVLTVDTGDASPLQVVCGAPNARAGLVGVFGGAGTYVPGSDFTLGKATIRGVESNGMMCSYRELKLGENHDGIIELPSDAPVGQGYAAWADLDDPIFDVAITPNRQDCMGVRGIARDLAAAGLGRLTPLEVPVIEGNWNNPVPIRIEDTPGCPAFFARSIRGVDNHSRTPDWMRRRLESAGQRSISAIVDITNYVMLDLGRPSHAYDVDKLTGGLTARAAGDGETIMALNGKEYELTEAMTVIADDAHAHDIAGIMGGEASGVDESSHDVLLEVAYFTPERIALTGQSLGLTSDARSRFERGVDPGFLDDGLAIITGHILAICGGEASHVTRVGEPPVTPRPIPLNPLLVSSLGGVEIPGERQQAILSSLGFVVSGDTAIVPSWRRDIDGPADLVEEILRIESYDRIPSTPLPRDAGVARPTATRAQLVERRVRRAAAARGLDEAIIWSFIPEVQAELFGGASATLANPISEDMKSMRPSLLPGLIGAAGRNLDRGATTVRLFEIGRRYLSGGEHPTATVLLVGDRTPRQWQSGKVAAFDAFDAKAEVLALLEAAGAPVINLQSMPNAGPHWHPGRSAALGLGPKTILARFGEIHPVILEALDAPGGIVAAELYLDAIPAPRSVRRARAAFTPPALQAVSRDFSFTVPVELSAEALIRAVLGVDKAMITGARIFDRYDGPAGLSLAVEVVFQPSDKSFTEAEIADLSGRIITAAGKIGARLRG